MVSTHRVVIPDLPGHGTSDAGGLDLTEALVMTWLEELIAQTCGEPPTLVGHILGGAIAARFAIGHADRIERLVLVDSLGLARFRPSLRFALGLLGFILRPTEREFDRDTLAHDMGEDWAAVRDYALELAREADVRAAMHRLMARVGIPPIPRNNLTGIDVPTTLIWGRHDRALPLSIAETASERYGWPLHVIEDAADDAPMEQPSAFVEVLRAVVSGGERIEPRSLALDPQR
jgi:pimeloyl-ACP methyl ester carboxylesterase